MRREKLSMSGPGRSLVRNLRADRPSPVYEMPARVGDAGIIPVKRADSTRGRVLLLEFQWNRAEQKENRRAKNANDRRGDWRAGFRPKMPVGKAD